LDCLSAENSHITVEHIDPGVLNTSMQKKIRNSENEVVSEARFFSNLKASGKLLEPDVVAKKIIKRIIG